MLNFPPKWHDPSHDELSFANELLQLHFQSALEDLLTICQTKVHSDTGRYASSGNGNNLAIYFLIAHMYFSMCKRKKVHAYSSTLKPMYCLFVHLCSIFCSYLFDICFVFLLAGDEKEHLKITLLRIHSALHGVMSCLPEIRPSYKDGRSLEVESAFFIAGSAGSTVGSSEMREKAAEFVHIACR
jgi:hypothetical protein